MIETTLHGLVVGLGKVRKDGSTEFRWLDKPIHNRIVSGGLDEYFMFNGTTGYSSDSAVGNMDNRFLGSYFEYNFSYTGVLNYIAIGTDGTATKFTDTSLNAQVGDFSCSDGSYRTIPYFGCRLNADNSISFRVPRVSVTVDTATTIREIGWFEKYTTGATYVMFSRVVLPSPVELEAGDKLIVVYQLNVSYGNLEESETPSSLLSGLLDADGNQLRGRASYRLYFRSSSANPPTVGTWFNAQESSSYWVSYGGNFLGSRISESFGKTSYKVYGSTPRAQYGFKIIAPFSTYSSDKNVALPYTMNPNFSMADQMSIVPMNQSATSALTESGTNITSWNPKPYVPGTYYRDREIVVSPAWPTMTTEQYQDIYAICHNCYLIRFGYMDTTDPDNPVWVPKPWRKQFGQSYKFTFRYKLNTVDTV